MVKKITLPSGSSARAVPAGVSPISSAQLQTSIKTLRKHSPYIKNSFYHTYNNGRIEGINNKIKVLNHVAYGYRNFTHYKNRILLHFKLKPVERTANKRIKNKTRPKVA
ncbi:transposase [Paraliobacillus sp. PM-2]|uniref:transposase n=1 Tax=Paraliobacillus sp. PM-2 TaxID=1462524 RepID=UPI0021000B25|nr:transposase [Paraliobacillus sp. PM-2]